MKKLRLTDMAWSMIVKRDETMRVLKNANIEVPEDIDDESLLKIITDNISIESVNYGIWQIAKSNPHIKHCHGCAHLFEND